MEVSNVCTRTCVGSLTDDVVFFNPHRLPWPAYTASAWMIIDAATRRARSQLLAAIDAVGGTDARNLEPRLVTGTNAARSALGVPMLIVFLGAFIFPILVRVRAIELSNLCFV